MVYSGLPFVNDNLTLCLCVSGCLGDLHPFLHDIAGKLKSGYKNRPFFLKIVENRWNRIGPNLKIIEFTIYCFKILEKDKNQQNICKKSRSFSRLLVKKFL
jgi:hypothetical protein